MNRFAYKDFLCKNPPVKEIENLTQDDAGEILFKTENNYIKSFIFPKNRENASKIYVYFSAIGIYRGEQTVYHRISWALNNNDIALCFDDPTRSLASFAPAFYVGYDNDDLISDIAEIIKKVQKINEIKSEDIYIIGSSNGGYAALKTANLLNNCNCLIFCPQFSIELYLGSKFDIFKGSLQRNFDISRENKVVEKILNNLNFSLTIYSNIGCASDNEQINYFKKLLNINIEPYNFYRENNLNVLIADIKTGQAHLAQPDYLETKILMKISQEKNLEAARRLSRIFYDSIEFRYKDKKREEKKKILSYGNNLNPIRYLLKNCHRKEVIGFVREGVSGKTEFGVKYLSESEVQKHLQAGTSEIVSFKDGGPLDEEIDKIRQSYYQLFEDFIPQKFSIENKYIDFASLTAHFSYEEIEQLYCYIRGSGKKICIIIGNCQTKALHELLLQSKYFTNKYVIFDIPRICDYSKAKLEPEFTLSLIQNVDLCITQPIKATNEFTPILSSEYIKQRLKKEAIFLTISNLTFCGFFPQMKEKNASIPGFSLGGNPLFPYADNNIDKMLIDGLPPDYIVNRILNPYYYDYTYLDSFFKSELAIFKERESFADVQMYDIVSKEVYKNLCFHAFNRPKVYLLEILANKILEKLGFIKIKEFEEINFSMDSQSQIVYPSVLSFMNVPFDNNYRIYINEMIIKEKVLLTDYIQIYINSKLLALTKERNLSS